jgi:hypothetical protein
MAIRTISAAGGNWNSTATWVGGVVPTTSDSVLGDATSGQLTVNVSATVQFLDFTNYTQTLTINSSITLTVNLAAATNTFGASMNFAGTGTMAMGTISNIWVQNTTNRIPNLSIGNSTVTKTISSNMYVNNFVATHTSNSPTFNGNTIYVGGNFGSSSIVGNGNGIQGTTIFELDGTGLIQNNFGGNMVITGTYNTTTQGLTLCVGGNLTFITGSTSIFNILLWNNFSANVSGNITINSNKNFNLFINNQASSTSSPTVTTTFTQTPNIDLLGCYTTSIASRGSISTTPTWIFSGASMNITKLSLEPFWRTTSSQVIPPVSPDVPLTYMGSNIKFDYLYTHSIGSIAANGGGIPSNPVISSNSSGNQVSINLGSKITTQIIDYDFTDVDASGGEQIVAINGTLSNTTNVTNVYPTGSSGATQTAYTFAS